MISWLGSTQLLITKAWLDSANFVLDNTRKDRIWKVDQGQKLVFQSGYLKTEMRIISPPTLGFLIRVFILLSFYFCTHITQAIMNFTKQDKQAQPQKDPIIQTSHHNSNISKQALSLVIWWSIIFMKIFCRRGFQIIVVILLKSNWHIGKYMGYIYFPHVVL